MIKVSLTAVLLLILFSTPSIATDWEFIGTVPLQSMFVRIFADKDSVEVVEEPAGFKKVWIKFVLPRSARYVENDKSYRVRKEKYYFHCDQKMFAVSHLTLLDIFETVVYDSGAFNPFEDQYSESWKFVIPSSGPYIIHSYLCGLAKKDLPPVKAQAETPPVPEKEVEIEESGFITSGTITGGETTDSLDIKKVRWADREEYERLVFDVYSWSGADESGDSEPQDKAGHFKVSKKEDENEIVVEIRGYRSFSAEMPDLDKSELIEKIEILKGEEYADDSGFTFKITIRENAGFKAFELENPGRIVIDVGRI